MLDSQDQIPVRDWITLGVMLLILTIVIVAGVLLAQNTSSSVNVVSGQLVTVTVNGTPPAKNNSGQGNGQPQDGQPGGSGVTQAEQKNKNQTSFFQVFAMLLGGAAVFTVLVSVLIALLVIQINRIFGRKNNTTDSNPPDLNPPHSNPPGE
jgi:hypothetical protein